MESSDLYRSDKIQSTNYPMLKKSPEGGARIRLINFCTGGTAPEAISTALRVVRKGFSVHLPIPFVSKMSNTAHWASNFMAFAFKRLFNTLSQHQSLGPCITGLTVVRYGGGLIKSAKPAAARLH